MSGRLDLSGNSPGVSESQQYIRFGLFEVDLRVGELRRSGSRVKLQNQPFQVLRILLESHGEVVTREELRSQLWPDGVYVDFDSSLSKAILKVRDALRDDAICPRYVETLPRVGYRFIAPIELLDVQTKAAPAADDKVGCEIASAKPRVRPVSPSLHRWWKIGTVVGIIALLSFCANWATRHYWPARQPARFASLAVLPLDNPSGDTFEDYLLDGFTVDLTASLARLGEIRVTSSNSAMNFKGTTKSSKVIGRELNAAAVIKGTLIRHGSTLHITLWLVDTASGSSVWSAAFEREERELMLLKTEVTHAIARQLGIRMIGPGPLSGPGPLRPEVYQLYARGRFFWQKRTEADLRKAVGYFQQAVDLDPAYAPAWAGIAQAYAPLLAQGFASPGEGGPPLRAAAIRALNLDDSLPEAHLAMAAAAAQAWDLSAAEAENRRAIQLNPSDATAHLWYGYLLEAMGRFQEDLRHRRLAYELDPLNVVTGVALAQALKFSGQREAAKEQFLKTLELFPESTFLHQELGIFLEGEGQNEMAIQEFKKARSMDALAHGYAVSGRRTEAKRLLHQMNAASALRYISPFRFAVVYAGLGDSTAALDYLERAYQASDHQLIRIKVDPRLSTLHSEPRFQRLLQRLHLSQ